MQLNRIKGQASTKTNHVNLPLEVQWPKGDIENVVACTTTRQTFHHEKCLADPTLAQSYDFFNVGDHVGDNPTTVADNRAKLLALFPENTKIQWLKQVHGDQVVCLNTHRSEAVIADAAITQEKHLALAVMTADCLPILLTNELGSEVAAIHGGWRPLASNIINKTIGKMLTQAEQVIAWLGPCIGPEHFEVGAEVRAEFIKLDRAFSQAFVLSVDDDNKYYANLQLIATLQLTALGVQKIARLPDCTYGDAQRYYSYRREKITGRMAAIICRL